MSENKYLFSPPYSETSDSIGLSFYNNSLGFGRVEATPEHPEDTVQVIFDDAPNLHVYGFGKRRVEDLEGGLENPINVESLIMSAVYAGRLFREMEQ